MADWSDDDKLWDVFLSHASEDKAAVVFPLAEGLRSRGLRVWLDADEITLGDSLRRKIDEGLAKSRFGVVVLSPSFFKRWPERELDGLMSREDAGTKVILPVRHDLGHDEIVQRLTTLSGKLTIGTDEGIDVVADAILKAVVAPPPPPVGPLTECGEHPEDNKHPLPAARRAIREESLRGLAPRRIGFPMVMATTLVLSAGVILTGWAFCRGPTAHVAANASDGENSAGHHLGGAAASLDSSQAPTGLTPAQTKENLERRLRAGTRDSRAEWMERHPSCRISVVKNNDIKYAQCVCGDLEGRLRTVFDLDQQLRNDEFLCPSGD